ncbi:MAG: hypothetical protein KAU50_02265, partial [Candidatus Marinimicrobia bacterium]|nr:hypothetical protein [Candidatus Neomarinimicrobiota bacterium]
MQSGIARLRKALSSIASDDLKIVVLREGKASLRQYEVRGKILAIVLLITLVALPVTYYIGAHLLLETAHSHRVARLRSDNARMKTMVYNFENRIKSLEQQIVSLSAMDEDLRAHAELPGIPNEIRRVGIGGGILDPSADIDYLLPGSDVSLAALSGKLDALTRGLKLEQISYEEIRDELKNDLSRLLRTPSVRPLTGGETNGR